jgi:hypothetical protein
MPPTLEEILGPWENIAEKSIEIFSSNQYNPFEWAKLVNLFYKELLKEISH